METGFQYWGSLIAILGICSTGFFYLISMVIKTSKEVAKPLQEIRDALLGSMAEPDKPGLFAQVRVLIMDFKDFQVQCNDRHERK